MQAIQDLMVRTAQYIVGPAPENNKSDSLRLELEHASFFSKMAGIAAMVVGVALLVFGLSSVMSGVAGGFFIFLVTLSVGTTLTLGGYEVNQFAKGLKQNAEQMVKLVSGIRKGDFLQIQKFWEQTTKQTYLLHDFLTYINVRMAMKTTTTSSANK